MTRSPKAPSHWQSVPVSAFRRCLLAALVVIPVACERVPDAASAPARTSVRMAVTTSTRDSGLLDHLTPPFEARHGAEMLIIAAGTGKALKLGENGDVDLVFVHAREAEEAFMAAGHGIRREPVMCNYFTILGPPDDPASIRGMAAPQALVAVAGAGNAFVSRGDASGTHKREMALWNAAGHTPGWSGYLESGRGMAATLVIASEKQAYVLTDMGTYLHFRDKVALQPLLDEQEALLNPYGILVVNPDKHPNVNHEMAEAFVDFIISPDAQQIIASYRIGDHSLFRPLRIPSGD